MQGTPRSLRPHIGIFGRRNVGKSSLINALVGQEVAIVSDVPGTTTDPVFKPIELLPFGPVVLIDTAGLDDEGFLGELRKQKSLEILRRCDVALLVFDGRTDFSLEREILALLRERGVLVLGVANKIDETHEPPSLPEDFNIPVFPTSAKTGQGILELKTTLIHLLQRGIQEKPLIRDLLHPGDLVVLVVPIDLGAPKGRLILPQVQTIREILDADAMSLVVKERELSEALERLKNPPRLVVTDSQVFHKVAGAVPPSVPITSFSILFARHKGDLQTFVAGVKAVEHLKPGDRILILEACTHHPLPDDIGRVKIPRWLRQYLGFEVHCEVIAGPSLSVPLWDYKLIIHCGGCMINPKEMLFRIGEASRVGVPITNYGVLIAYLHGLFPRALEVFPEMAFLKNETISPLFRKIGGRWSL
ncbi:MAG: [FeFe] hydrogenase H-cluster maturation GTPase HydF [Candidatus Caldatribacterium sp.]|uniref:[FeFe] hydrogenase H-cluster maturation GTPase HydF n=1 Tax=Candidatus Caldatribacterium sp. TaxID=2282143 RepID=UPI002991A483|nr:[FeFe] hydrogenase H-cluster maturation GTPase HydF [Candidatus Caldatribacterium sp.]MCX7729669.1 [FeFe] hydrogenase H-cluster maturation GTPase HydF [Candidatus Caldatribacterium sp.]MDW8081687.1 [FeFe] hydrogenase H-cluster maturation GTPase HydF [Candidatus Calescibacterium sp.]